jgi:hypothetical protein
VHVDEYINRFRLANRFVWLILSIEKTTKMRLSNTKSFIALLAMVFALASCGKIDEKKQLIGIWKLAHLNINGMEVTDGKGFIEFKEDGRNIVRTAPGRYEFGKWEINPEIKEIIMNDERSGAHYKYEMAGDSLTMTMNIPSRVTTLRLQKTDKYPIDPAAEGQSPDLFK